MMIDPTTHQGSAAKTRSEDLFETYLAGLSVEFDYESDYGGKHPDYALKSACGDHVGIIEVEEFAPLNPLPDDFRPDSYGRIREKINSARNHFSSAKHLPCLLVLYDNGSPVRLDEDTIYAAMLGDLTIQVPVTAWPGQDAIPNWGSRVIFGRGGKMRRGNHSQNTTISGVAILETVYVEQRRSGYEAEKADLCGEIKEGASFLEICRALGPLLSRLERKYRRRSMDFDRSAPRLRIFQNPYARIEWPRSLASDADEIWGQGADGTLIKLVDGLAPISRPRRRHARSKSNS